MAKIELKSVSVSPDCLWKVQNKQSYFFIVLAADDESQ